jgi:hypothetical protein
LKNTNIYSKQKLNNGAGIKTIQKSQSFLFLSESMQK